MKGVERDEVVEDGDHMECRSVWGLEGLLEEGDGVVGGGMRGDGDKADEG